MLRPLHFLAAVSAVTLAACSASAPGGDGAPSAPRVASRALVPVPGPEQVTDAPAPAPAPGDEEWPAVATTGSVHLAVWIDRRNGKKEVRGARVQPDGTLLDPFGILVSSPPSGVDARPAVASDGSGWLVVWEDGAGGIRANRVDGAGAVLDANGFVVSATGAAPSVIATGAGAYAVAWQDGSPLEVRIRLVQGGSLGAQTSIVRSGFADAPANTRAFSGVGSPALAYDPGGRILAVYVKIDGANGGKVVAATFLADSDLAAGSEIPLAAVGAGDGVMGPPAVARGAAEYMAVFGTFTGQVRAVVVGAGDAVGATTVVQASAASNPAIAWAASIGAYEITSMITDPFVLPWVSMNQVTSAGVVNPGVLTYAIASARSAVSCTAGGCLTVQEGYLDESNPVDIWGYPGDVTLQPIRLSSRVNEQALPVAAFAAGGYVVVWDDTRSDSLVSEVPHWLGWDATGAPAARPAWPVSAFATVAGARPVATRAVFPGPLERVLVAFQQSGEIRAAVLNPTLTGGGTSEFLPAGSTSLETSPAVACDGALYCLVAWRDEGVSPTAIRGSRHALNGSRVDAAQSLAISAAGAVASAPALAHAGLPGGGTYLAVWKDARVGGNGDIRGTLVDVAANGTATVLATDVAAGAPAQGAPAVASDGTGFLAVWEEGTQIAWRTVSAAGDVLGPVSSTSLAGGASQPAVAWDGSWYVIAFRTQGASSGDIYAVPVSAGGAAIAPPYQVSAEIADEQHPTVASDGASHLLVAYEVVDAALGARRVRTRLVQSLSANGETCSGDGECQSGHCSGAPGTCFACDLGAACTPANECHTGTWTCAGSAQCADQGTDLPDGTQCGTGQYCASGACGACPHGDPCTLDACMNAEYDCAVSGTPQCKATTPVAAGAGCGSGQVCDGAGACVPCDAGATCAPSVQCKVAAIGCDTGAPVCADTGDAPDDTPCDVMKVCSAGACACVPGLSCAPPGQPCHAGRTQCASGVPSCQDLATLLPNGSPCGPDLVCNGGNCIACAAGGDCPFVEPSSCHGGVWSCATGAATCVPEGPPVTDGAECGAGKICSAGSCVTPARTESVFGCATGGEPALLGIAAILLLRRRGRLRARTAATKS